MSRRVVIAICAWLAAMAPVIAQEDQAKPVEPLALSLPESADGCLSMLEAIIERAAAADMLDDQIDKAEAQLERMEVHCLEKRFVEALESAKAVMALVAANK